jgi:hypothetical protein
VPEEERLFTIYLKWEGKFYSTQNITSTCSPVGEESSMTIDDYYAKVTNKDDYTCGFELHLNPSKQSLFDVTKVNGYTQYKPKVLAKPKEANPTQGNANGDGGEEETKDAAGGASSNKNTNKPNVVTLKNCLELFSAEEQLGEDNEWYCNKCKEFR